MKSFVKQLNSMTNSRTGLPSVYRKRLVYDNFNRTDGVLGSGWTRTTALDQISIVSNQVVSNAVQSNPTFWMRTGETYLANQYVSARLGIGWSSGDDCGVTLRWATGNNGYSIETWTNRLYVSTWTNGVQGSINGSAFLSPALAAGSLIEATIIGSTIKVYHNRKLVLTRIDSTYTTGNPGLFIWINDAPLDDFEAGNVF